MKKCKKCNTVQNDSRSVCVECGAVLGKPMKEDEEYEVKASLEEKLDDLTEQSDDFYVPVKDRIIDVLCIIGGISSLVLTMLSNKADISNAARSGFISIIFPFICMYHAANAEVYMDDIHIEIPYIIRLGYKSLSVFPDNA